MSEIDAYNTEIGIVLMQEGNPVAFLRKELCPRNQALSTCDKEYLAILMRWISGVPHPILEKSILEVDVTSLSD